ncbi:MAG: SUMF1/EgtB/PvdO family nonheme iron enzyme [Akkermansiaceae bacterium]|nr:SUMF1/EgtB/PvdO family nonheme iron enzyme [Akkermansiaceae bacterium]MCF7732272.1 SUMF1/EgtB/PvdO family nonheme iron enzyme [Akkermansiaceae bacterium]
MKNLKMMFGQSGLLTLLLGLIAGDGLMAATPQVKFGPWYTTGPLPAQAFNEALFPEQGVDLAAKNAAGKALWTPQPQWTDGRAQELPAAGRASTYLFRTLTTAKPAQVSVNLGSDDGLEVWLNGKKRLSQDVARGVSADSATVILDLQPGSNLLLLKIYNQSGNHGFSFTLGACQTRLAPASAKEFPALRGMPGTREAIEDLLASHGDKYAQGKGFLDHLNELERALNQAETALAGGDQGASARIAEVAAKFTKLQREAMLANPLLDFEKLLLIKRGAGSLGLPQNWQANCGVGSTGYDNEIAVLSPVSPDGNLTTLMKPAKSEFVGDLKLDFSGDKMLFSMPGTHGRWQVWELKADGSGLRQVTPGDEPDVDNYDPCYLPDGRMLFTSTRGFAGVPCVGGGNQVANICKMNADGTGIRQLCFDQDQNWCPTVLNDGSVLYTRWEYSDTPHYFTRILFRMNPDGSGQMSYYGSNSYWPNSFFYAKPVPGHPTKLVSVISGHHGVPRMGELIVFDPAQARFEADGVVQRIPGNSQEVKPVIADGLVDGSWPKFLHPYPLSEKYFLVSCQPTQGSKWGIYLVDVFDNMTLIKELDGYVLFEPIPLRATTRPPVIPDRIDLTKKDATVYLADIYAGPGLKGVPRGTVKKIRLYEPHFGYQGMGGHINIGIDGPWDVHRILGTVPVEADGSASFKVPANTPVAVQPLDAEGKAIQLMRSWYTAMPGESFSCNGCHDTSNALPPGKPALASLRQPSTIEPWYGPARGFSFKREVQPVLDKYCVGCHQPGAQPVNGQAVPDFTAKKDNGDRNFTPSYIALHPFVRRPGPESDYHLLNPLEYHADTSELVQMLKRGHHNVKLDAEAWDRIVTWIDLNVPDHGTWTEHVNGVRPVMQRRMEMFAKYANRTDDPEFIPEPANEKPIRYIAPAPAPARKPANLRVAGWPFDAAAATKRLTETGLPTAQKIPLADGKDLDLVLVPAGEFIMGDATGEADEFPVSRAKIAQPFYMGATEITNAQYAAFDTQHDSGVISMTGKDQGERGAWINQPNQPVVRVTWDEVMAFCKWLSQKTGKEFTLPTESQWEWACRGGTESPFFYGNRDTDFSKFANLADASLNQLDRGDAPPWHPRDRRFNDGCGVTTDVGRYQPNAWGLRDMHGNAAEWTLSSYRPYPYTDSDGRNDPKLDAMKTVRGGSWFDRPFHTGSAARLPYRPWQKVYNVGFRVVMSAEGVTAVAASGGD